MPDPGDYDPTAGYVPPTTVIDDPLEPLYRSGKVIRPQPTPAQVYEQNQKRRYAAQDTVENNDIRLGIRAGGNTVVNLYNDFQRNTASGEPDPNFDHSAWIEANRAMIPPEQAWRFMQTKNARDSAMLLQDLQTEGAAQEQLAARGGFRSMTASALVGLVDVDAPLMLLSGGAAGVEKAGILSTKFGRMAAGAAFGGATGASVAAINVAADPTADWTSIPAAGLIGMGLGGVTPIALHGGKAIQDAQHEFSRAVEDGVPLANKVNEDVSYPDVSKERTAPPPTEADAPKAFTLDAEGKPVEAPKTPELPTTDETSPKAFSTDGVQEGTGQSTLGAAQLNTGGGINSVVDEDQRNLIMNAQQRLRKSGNNLDLDAGWDKVEDVVPGVARAGKLLNRFINATPLRSLFQQFQDSDSTVAKMLGQDTLVNPRGVATNARSSALLRYQYQQQLMGSGIPGYSRSFENWSAAQGKTWLERQVNQQHFADFEREVALELQNRRYGQPLNGNLRRPIDPHVSAAADAHDAFSELELNIYKGREGETPVNGWKDIDWKPGYMEQRWSGAKMRKLIDGSQGSITAQHLADAIAENYTRMHSWMQPDKAKVYAKAVVDRALQREDGISTNLSTILSQDGRDALEAMMLRNGVPGKDVQDMLDHLTADMDEKGLQGRTKQRIDVDLRSTSQHGIQLVDMVETNLMNGMARRARGASGRAALARVTGIAGPADRALYKAAILAEQRMNNVGAAPSLTGNLADKAEQAARSALYDSKQLTPQQIDDYFSVWGEGATAGGVSPAYSRVMKLTNLSLLNMLGLTQLAETGPLIAAYGWEKFMHYAGDSIQSSLHKGDSELTQELAHMNVFQPEHLLFRADMNHELEKAAGIQTEFMANVDHGLNLGQRLQGMMSGYYKIKEFQQRIAVTAGADKIMTYLAGFNHRFSPERLAEIGLTPTMQGKLRAMIDDGTIEFRGPNTRGVPDMGTGDAGIFTESQQFLHKLNLEQWDPDTREEFVNILNLQMFKQIQQAMAGETSMIFHKDGLAALFLHLKSFPLLAMAKQSERHLRTMDSESLGALVYGLMTAGAVYSAGQAIKGNTDNLTPDKVMKGAFGMSNLTGWLPMFTDPVASMLGMDNLKFNSYAHGIDGNVISMPAAYPVLNRMANIPGALVSPITGALGLSKGPTMNDMRALQATPIIGNSYGLAALFGQMKRAQPQPAKRVVPHEAAPKPVSELVLPQGIQDLAQ